MPISAPEMGIIRLVDAGSGRAGAAYQDPWGPYALPPEPLSSFRAGLTSAKYTAATLTAASWNSISVGSPEPNRASAPTAAEPAVRPVQKPLVRLKATWKWSP